MKFTIKFFGAIQKIETENKKKKNRILRSIRWKNQQCDSWTTTDMLKHQVTPSLIHQEDVDLLWSWLLNGSPTSHWPCGLKQGTTTHSASVSFFFFFWPCPEARGILVSQPGIKPASLHWRHTVITTRCRGGKSFLLFNDKGGNSLTLQRKEHRLDKYFLPSFFLPMNRKDDLKSRLIKHLEVNQGGSRE